jgi:uncharacterized protein YuzE
VRIEYYPDTDSLVIQLKEGGRGPGYAEDITPDGNVTVHYSVDDELLSVEIQGRASKMFDADAVSVSVIDRGGDHPRGIIPLASERLAGLKKTPER